MELLLLKELELPDLMLAVLRLEDEGEQAIVLERDPEDQTGQGEVEDLGRILLLEEEEIELEEVEIDRISEVIGSSEILRQSEVSTPKNLNRR